MARSLGQSVTRLSLFSAKSPPPPPSPRIFTLRAQSNQSQKTDLDYDIDSTAPAPTTDPDLLAYRKIEDAIHRIIVRRSAPDWLPFVPGASYWVPPRSQTHGIAELFGKFAHKLTEDEALSLTTERGWPSSAYFAKGASPHHMEVETTSNMSESEDEEE